MSPRSLLGTLKSRKYIVAAYLFGSAASGRQGPLSDIDIAILLDKKTKTSDYSDIQLMLIKDLASFYPNKNIDITLLNNAPLLLRYEVFRNNQILFSRGFSAREAFEVQSTLQYFDFNYYSDRMSSAIIQQTAGELLHG